MQNKMPHFKYIPANVVGKQAAHIKTEENTIYKIEEPNEYFKEFGYTVDMAKAGVLPDEFIWAEYIQKAHANFTACIQIQIIRYLTKHSDIFRKTHGEQCATWLAAHAAEKCSKGVTCVACITMN
jgi:hypothetical protein